jgi:small nuclear ribonucleoprotein (snRNP)-like protein
MLKTRIGYLCALKLDMQSGAVLHETGQHFRLLLEEARETERNIHVTKGVANTDEINENNALEMMKLYIRGEEIKRESEILENPSMRNRVVKMRCVVVQTVTETNTLTVSMLRVAWSCRR